MLQNMTMGQPVPRVRRLQQDIDSRADRHDHRVLPHQVPVTHAVPLQHQKALPVDVDRVVHGMKGSRVVEQADLDNFAPLESPVDVHVLLICCCVAQGPGHVPAG